MLPAIGPQRVETPLSSVAASIVCGTLKKS
jgi:hypothetical protein